MEKSQTILIVAGEASGDLHAANLVGALKKENPRLCLFGLGGEKLKNQGVSISYDIVSLAVVGLWEVVRNLGTFKAIFDNLLKEIDERKPRLAILVDYPGFNLRLAQELKKRNIPVVYYISPQVWAWGKERIPLIRRVVDHMIVFFKFEEELYKKERIPVSFFGHPLLDVAKAQRNKKTLLETYHIPDSKYTVALLPGSREKEVKNILPVMLASAELLHKKLIDIKFLILRAPTVSEETFKTLLKPYCLPIYILTDTTYDGLNASDLALVASGTATLETAIMQIPMAIIYKISFLTWLYARIFIKIPFIGLVNIIAGTKVVPEFIQHHAKPRDIACFAEFVLTNPAESDRIKKQLRVVTEKLGAPQTIKRHAEVIARLLAT
ncbi:MAG: lipid-A-disaccharide synthase [Candidatus Omnitrophica bacterium]|nr:lipid-A-disaccharide synthase [Candidatus Omnitrophota bacterium]